MLMSRWIIYPCVFSPPSPPALWRNKSEERGAHRADRRIYHGEYCLPRWPLGPAIYTYLGCAIKQKPPHMRLKQTRQNTHTRTHTAAFLVIKKNGSLLFWPLGPIPTNMIVVRTQCIPCMMDMDCAEHSICVSLIIVVWSHYQWQREAGVAAFHTEGYVWHSFLHSVNFTCISLLGCHWLCSFWKIINNKIKINT